MSTLGQLWHSLTTPFAESEEAARRERMTRVIFVMVSIGFLLASVIVSAFDLLVGEPSYTPILLMMTIDGLVLVAWYLIFRKRWYISRYLLPVIFLALGTYIISQVGLISTGVLQLAIAVLLTSMLFGNKAQWIAVGISEILYLSVGWLTGERDVEVFATGGIVVGFSLSGMAALQWYASTLLDSSFERLRRAETASREAAGKTRAIFESINDGITITDLQGTITDFNEATMRLLNFEHRDELAGLSAFDLISRPERPKAMASMQSTFTNGASGVLEYKIIRKDGKEFDGELNAVLIKDEVGQPLGFAALTRDITSRKQAEVERETLIRELEEKNRELESFTYTVPHDIKAPLVTIAGFLGYLAQDVENCNADKVQKDIQHINQAVIKMQHLLNELLELSRIGRMANSPEQIPFYDIVQDALKHIEGGLAGKKIDIRVQENLPAVYGDRVRLVEVLQNLIDNAIKFMGDQADPRIEIGQSNDAERGRAIFYVKDNGIGIDLAHHERIFGLFNKLDPRAEGTGIGLAIVKKIVEVHGGRIWVESETGMGATFCFTLPFHPAG